MKRDPKTKSMIRTFLVYIAVLAVGILILVKAVLVQTKEGDELRALAEQMETRYDTVQASRGDILACDGSILSTDVPIFEVGINPSAIPDTIFKKGLDELCQKLAEMFPRKNVKQWKESISNAKKGNKKDYRLDANATLAQYHELEKCSIFHQGNKTMGLLKKDPRFIRIHPYDPLAGRIVGYIKKDKIVGLESAYDTILRGKDGLHKQRKIHDGDNNIWVPVEDENNIEVVNGNDIVTTIDIGIQDITERTLRDALIENNAYQGCAIVMDVKTGEIKALTNLQRDYSTNQCREDYNFALADGIEPGSTFKLASMLVLLEKHPELNVNTRNVNIGVAGSKLSFGGKPMADDHAINESGWVTIREVFEQSSNKGTAKLITDYFGNHPEEYIDGLYSLGLNQRLNTGILGEAAPEIKHPIHNKDVWWKTSLSRMSIGYEVKLSPLQILTLYNAVANDGRMMKPMFVKEVRKDGVTLQTIDPVVLNEHIASPRTIDTIQSMLQGVVLRGTAKRQNGTEYGIAGKTGTAKLYNEKTHSYEWINAEGRAERNYNVTFVGFFPAEQPVYSCIVVVNKAHRAAGTVAAPIFREIADRVYAIRIKGLIETPLEKDESKLVEYKPVTDPSQYAPMVVPDTKGMNVTDAIYLLENMGWITTFEGHGQVVQQSVPAGDSLRAGGLIKLTLARK